MPIKKSELYSSLWQSCDELRGGMDASQYKDYVLVLLFMKYVSDKAASQKGYLLDVPKGGSFADMMALKGDKEIGDKINKIIARLAEANDLKGVIDVADFNDADKLGKVEQTRIAGFQKFQNFRSGQGAVLLPRLGVNRQTRIFFLNCALRCCRCCLCRNTISGVGQEPFIQFFGSFHNLFFTELTRVCRLSPFTKKRNRQPSPVGVVFRGHHERAGWFCGDAVRVRGRRRRTGKRDLNN